MIRVIETNLSLDYENNIMDHQSRVIVVYSWEDYINEIKDAKSIPRTDCVGRLHGRTIPKLSKVKNVVSDDFHLSCDVYNCDGLKSKKLCYKV